MRVIAGSARGVKLSALPGEEITRPTIDRVKESMFSSVQFLLEGAEVLDLFAGSGQLGIEALSRGAKRCVFIDQDRGACEIVRQNLRAAGLAGKASVSQTQAQHFLSTAREPFDLILMDPPYHEHAFDGALAVIYNAGTKENAGIFSQSQGWIILAEALHGHGNRAFTYFMENAPAAQNDRAEIRKLEPYCYGQFTEGKASPHFGRSHVHWLTGTASTVMVGCVEGILGMRPDFYGLRIAPSIPKEWDGFEVEKDFRGNHLHIVVSNPGHVETGCKKLLVNGAEMEGDYIPAELLTEHTEIELLMS